MAARSLTFKKKYEYVGTEMKGDKTLDKIKSRVTEVELKQDPASDSPLKIVKSNLKVAASEGTILFDREEGHVVSAQGKDPVKGDMMTYSFNGMEIPGALDLTMETERRAYKLRRNKEFAPLGFVSVRHITCSCSYQSLRLRPGFRKLSQAATAISISASFDRFCVESSQ